MGHESVTTALVAKRSRIPEPSVLYHFPTKDHLLVAALRCADDEAAAALGLGLGDGDGDIPLDLAAIRTTPPVDEGRDLNRARLNALVRSLAMNPEHPAAAFMEERNLRAVRVWAAMIARRQRDGLADPALNPEFAAWQAIGLLDGLTVIAQTHPELPVGDLLADGLLRLMSPSPQEVASI